MKTIGKMLDEESGTSRYLRDVFLNFGIREVLKDSTK